MSTGYSQAQLADLWQEMEVHLPPMPTETEKPAAPRITAMLCAGTELGTVFNLGFKDRKSLVMFFNCAIAKELAGAINHASQHYGWSKKGMTPAPSSHLTYPVPEDLASAIAVTSLSTNALPGGMLVNFYMPQYGESGATMVFYFPRQAAMEFMTYVVQAGEQAQWWDSDFELIPGRGLN